MTKELLIAAKPQLRLKRLGIDSYQENIVYMQAECPVCKSEGFKAQTRVEVSADGKSIIATLNVIHSDLLSIEEASLSEIAFSRLKLKEGDLISIKHLEPLGSMAYVRSKVYGNRLSEEAYVSIINDITHGKYSDVQLAAFVAACSGKGRMNIEEITALTNAMVDSGNKLVWGKLDMVDKHCIGGLPGNRTSPIVVAILAAAGLNIAKTSSRAITSPAGTADVMEVMTDVDLSLEEIQKIVREEGACLVWGGKVSLSPADDILIKVERALDIDSESQLIASVLSKKAAAGSSFVLLEIPVGETAKVRSWESAEELKSAFEQVAKNINLDIKVLLTDGSQPIGRGIGPALEAIDVLKVLRNDDDAPDDLRKKAVALTGAILEAKGKSKEGEGAALALTYLSQSKALSKFMSICNSQGGFQEPTLAPFSRDFYAIAEGNVTSINNRKLSMAAKLAGAPIDKRAGIRLNIKLGEKIEANQALLTVYAESEGILEYVFAYIDKHPDIIEIKDGNP